MNGRCLNHWGASQKRMIKLLRASRRWIGLVIYTTYMNPFSYMIIQTYSNSNRTSGYDAIKYQNDITPTAVMCGVIHIGRNDPKKNL